MEVQGEAAFVADAKGCVMTVSERKRLHRAGYTILIFPAEEVENHPERVEAKILAAKAEQDKVVHGKRKLCIAVEPGTGYFLEE